MKLLFTQDALVNAGAERSHLEILSRFSKATEVVFVYFYPKHDLRNDYEKAGIRLIFLDIPESYHLPLAVRRMVALIREEKPDLLVSCLWRADIITRIASWITGVPLVGTLVNDSYSPLAWKDKKGLKHKLVYWLDRITAGIPKHWVANAQALVDSHEKTLGLNRAKVSVIYRGRPIHRSVPASPLGESARDDSSIRHFISYGRLLERKGFQDAIQAFSRVLKEYPDCTLTIFGEGTYRNNLESLIQELGLQASVFLPGKISNPMDTLLNGYCFQSSPNQQIITAGFDLHNSHCSGAQSANCQLPTANCFLFPSWYEGFSGALVEAMMAGIPIIASDIPMNLEAVEDQHSALVFPVGDVQAFTRQMQWAIRNPDRMKTMGQAAKRVAIVRFDIETIAREYEDVLRKIVSAG